MKRYKAGFESLFLAGVYLIISLQVYYINSKIVAEIYMEL